MTKQVFCSDFWILSRMENTYNFLIMEYCALMNYFLHLANMVPLVLKYRRLTNRFFILWSYYAGFIRLLILDSVFALMNLMYFAELWRQLNSFLRAIVIIYVPLRRFSTAVAVLIWYIPYRCLKMAAAAIFLSDCCLMVNLYLNSLIFNSISSSIFCSSGP